MTEIFPYLGKNKNKNKNKMSDIQPGSPESSNIDKPKETHRRDIITKISKVKDKES